MMKGGISVKTIIVLVILVLVGVLGFFGVNTVRTYMSGASADFEPKGVLAKVSEDKKSVEIGWTTDKESTGVVEYGTTPASLLLRAAESELSLSHKVVIPSSSLKAGVTYYYRIRIGEEVYDNSGIPFTFKNGTVDDAAVKPTVTAEPTEVVLVPTVVSVTATGSGERCNRNTDYNHDGVINSLDYIQCIKTSGSPAAISPTGAVPTLGSGCKIGVDYDGDGVINSQDYIKCLQNKK